MGTARRHAEIEQGEVNARDQNCFTVARQCGEFPFLSMAALEAAIQAGWAGQARLWRSFDRPTDSPYVRHPSESWGPLKRFSNGNGSGDASFRWHDEFEARP